jgi:hypothetical protein
VPATPPAHREGKRRGSGLRVLAFVAMSAAFGVWLWNDGSARRAATTAVTPPPGSTPATPAPPSSASNAAPPSASSSPVASSAAVPAVDAASAVSIADAGDDGLAGFDLASAMRALNRIHYGECHVPTPGVVSIAFNSSGRVKKVAVVQGDYDPETASCVLSHFGAAAMTPFRGASQTVTANLAPTP